MGEVINWIPGTNYRFRLAPYQAAALYCGVQHLAMLGGVGVGKSFTGAHFAVQKLLEFPTVTGFIGANTYDQLSQVSLRELFYWLDHYKIEWVIDCIPPESWGPEASRKKFKDYGNILSIRHPATHKPVHAFTRVLSDPDPLRGIEFSWYWIDETRDTPQETHDVLLARLRESPYISGIITSTTNGQDWVWDRFVKNADGRVYGSMHIPTIEAVHLGILTQQYFDTLQRSYSHMFALQELWAKHVNVHAGRAYYAASEQNRRRRAPWGDAFPNRERPLVVGCDFNFSPAPHIWMIGQLGPVTEKHDYTQHIHWFSEISKSETSTRTMTGIVLQQYPDFFYRVFGDASGGVGTTSNAGETDYLQMGQEFGDAEAAYSIDYYQEGYNGKQEKRNPIVRDRVENVNSKLCNSMGEISLTYDPERCPNFDQDLNMVGWKPTTMRGRGRLDDGGDKNRTHASDAVGYSVFKLLPPRNRGLTIQSIPTQANMLGAR